MMNTYIVYERPTECDSQPRCRKESGLKRGYTMNRFRTLTALAVAMLTTAAATAQPTLTVDDEIIPRGASGLVDVVFSDAATVTGIDLVLRYDSDIAWNPSVVTDGTPTDGWSIATKVNENVAAGNIDEIRISMAGSDALGITTPAAMGLQIDFTVVDSPGPISTPIEVTLAVLNETDVLGTATNGSISIGGTTGTIELSGPTPFKVGDEITVTVVDADLIGAVDFDVTITNTTPEPDEVETVTMSEDPANPGTFIGTIFTEYGTAKDLNGKLGVQDGDGAAVTATYDDALTANAVAEPITSDPGDLTIDGGTTATVELSGPSPFQVGDDITIEVYDPDLDPAVVTSIEVTLTNTTPEPDEVETVTLSPKAGGPAGTYTAVFGTEYGTTAFDNDKLGVQDGDGGTVTAAYTDPFADSGGELVVTSDPADLPTIDGGTTATVTLTGPTPFQVGDDITIEVYDPDLDPAVVTSIEVTLTNTTPEPDEVETVTLSPKAGGPAGTYTAVFGTEYGTTAFDNDKLGVQDGDGGTVTAAYTDPFADSGDELVVTSDPADLPTIDGGTTATITVTPTTLSPGDDITITVFDPDLDPAVVTSIEVTIINTTADPDEIEVVILYPAASPPAPLGTYTGAITTEYGTAGVDNEFFGIAPGATVGVEYVDPFNDAGTEETVEYPGDGGTPLTIESGNTGTVTASAGVQAGGGLRIKVTDPDLPATVEVTVRNLDLPSEELTVTVPETAAGSGIYQVEVATSTAPGVDVVAISPRDDLEIVYEDVLADDGSILDLTTSSVATLWGDVSTNGLVGAFDAGLILQENVGVPFIIDDAYQEAGRRRQRTRCRTPATQQLRRGPDPAVRSHHRDQLPGSRVRYAGAPLQARRSRSAPRPR